jgi:DNA-binding SARP family transcriptional activator
MWPEADTPVRDERCDSAFATVDTAQTSGVTDCKFGVAIADHRGELIAADSGFCSLLTRPGAAAIGSTCCEILGCRRRGGGLEHVCLTELTLATGGVRELRGAAPHASGAGPVRVTTSLLAGEEGHVVIEVRPAGNAERTDAPRRLVVLTLGRTRVEDDGGSLGGAWLEQRPAQLLKYLITERHRVVAADEIAEALWQDVQTASLNNVRQCVHALRQRLEPDRAPRAASSFITAHRGGYALERAYFGLDADEFEALVASGVSLFEARSPGLAAEQLEAGLSLYRGDFLADEPYADWALTERNRLADIASTGLRTLAAIRLQAGDYEAASRPMERLAELDSYDVAVQHDLIRLCITRGRLSDAKRRYASLRSRLMRDFGQQPGFALADVASAQELSGERLLA